MVRNLRKPGKKEGGGGYSCEKEGYWVFFFFKWQRAGKTTGVTHRAALVEGDCWEIEAFEQVLIGNTLAHSIFEENHL